MNKEQFARLLNGRTYGEEITKEEQQIAEENGLLICFGESDDLLELRGIIDDEVGAYNGGTASIIKKKNGSIDVISDYHLEKIEELYEDDIDLNLKIVTVTAEWSPEDLDCLWRITSKIPNATFDIMEDDELYCRGIVIEKEDILNALK